MAWDTTTGFFTLPASTKLTQFRFVDVNTSGKLAFPTLGRPVVGVLVSSGTTASTNQSQVGTVQAYGVVRVSAPASTLAKGDWVAASSIGQAVATTAGANAVGKCIDGSSGSAGRILSVLLLPAGTTRKNW